MHIIQSVPRGLVGCGTWLIFRVGFGRRVRNRSGKRDYKYKRERDNAFLRGRDAGIVRYSMAGYGITISCTRETLSQGKLLISQGTSAILSEMRMMETSTSPVVEQRRKNSRRTNRKDYLLCLVEYQHSVELFGSITGKVETKFLKLRKQLKRKQMETTLGVKKHHQCPFTYCNCSVFATHRI